VDWRLVSIGSDSAIGWSGAAAVLPLTDITRTISLPLARTRSMPAFVYERRPSHLLP